MGVIKMYKYRSKQISFTDFNTPIGMKLNPNNRWVKKAEMIPWDEIEQRYAKLFTNRKGNVAKPLRLALGACIIQAEYGYSDEEVALQIPGNGKKSRTYRKKARKQYLHIARSKKRTAKKVRKAIGQQL